MENTYRKMKPRKSYSTLLILVIVLSLILGCQNATPEKDTHKSKGASNDKIKLSERMTIESKRKSEKPWSNEILWETIYKNGSDASFSARINENVDEFNFKLIGHFDELKRFIPSHIEIRNLSNGKLIQEIIVGDKFDKEEIGYSGRDLGFADMVQLVDINFDGYIDLRILLYTGATGCNFYASCLYNPTLKKFVFNKNLSKMSALRVDPNSKQIITYDRSGGCQETMRYYKVSDNKFILTKAEWSTLNNADDIPCYKLTGIPLQGLVITDNDIYDFNDHKGRLRKKLKVIKKEALQGSIDGRERNMMGVPIQ